MVTEATESHDLPSATGTLKGGGGIIRSEAHDQKTRRAQDMTPSPRPKARKQRSLVRVPEPKA